MYSHALMLTSIWPSSLSVYAVYTKFTNATSKNQPRVSEKSGMCAGYRIPVTHSALAHLLSPGPVRWRSTLPSSHPIKPSLPPIYPTETAISQENTPSCPRRRPTSGWCCTSDRRKDQSLLRPSSWRKSTSSHWARGRCSSE